MQEESQVEVIEEGPTRMVRVYTQSHDKLHQLARLKSLHTNRACSMADVIQDLLVIHDGELDFKIYPPLSHGYDH